MHWQASIKLKTEKLGVTRGHTLTSYAIESSGWYWKKKGETLWDLETNCGKGVQESKQNLAWFEATGPVKSSVEIWCCWCPMSRSGSRKLRRRRRRTYCNGLYLVTRDLLSQVSTQTSTASSKSVSTSKLWFLFHHFQSANSLTPKFKI